MKTQRQPTGAQHKSTVTLPNDTDVVVVRAFNAPRELVFDAWTKPALLQRWMLGPPGWTMPVCEMDVRPGGKFKWRWRSEKNGKEFGFWGEFREVVRPSRLVHVDAETPHVEVHFGYDAKAVNVTGILLSEGIPVPGWRVLLEDRQSGPVVAPNGELDESFASFYVHPASPNPSSSATRLSHSLGGFLICPLP